MVGKSKSAIRMAVRGCLVRCQQRATPLACLVEFAEKLAEFGWDQDAIHEVECRVLVALMGRWADKRAHATPRWSAAG